MSQHPSLALLGELRSLFSREPVDLFHAVVKTRPAEIHADDCLATLANLAATVQWPQTFRSLSPRETLQETAWTSPSGWEERHIFVDCTRSRSYHFGLVPEFHRLGTRAWQLLESSYQPQPVHSFPKGSAPRPEAIHTRGYDWRWWIGFLYMRLKDTRMVVRETGKELRDRCRPGAEAIPASAEIAYLTVDPFCASAFGLSIAGSQESPPLSPASPQKPRWDGDNRTLYFRAGCIKTYKASTAHRQIEILEAFEKEGWPSVIPEPFNNQSLLSQSLRYLNKALPLHTIRFSGEGSGGVRWDPLPPP
jgi:hypothetical protein